MSSTAPPSRIDADTSVCVFWCVFARARTRVCMIACRRATPSVVSRCAEHVTSISRTPKVMRLCVCARWFFARRSAGSDLRVGLQWPVSYLSHPFNRSFCRYLLLGQFGVRLRLGESKRHRSYEESPFLKEFATIFELFPPFKSPVPLSARPPLKAKCQALKFSCPRCLSMVLQFWQISIWRHSNVKCKLHSSGIVCIILTY